MTATATVAFREPSRWIALGALLIALGVLLTPDCCLNGRHAQGFGMDYFGPICHATN